MLINGDNIPKEEKKQKAINLLEIMQINKTLLAEYQNFDIVPSFASLNFQNAWCDFGEEIKQKIKELEEKYNLLVYAVTKDITSYGELYNFLIIPDYAEDWQYLLTEFGAGRFRVFAYVWNKTHDQYSEFGSIIVRAVNGTIERIS